MSPLAARHRPEVVVYTRATCGLCRRAEALVAREARRAVVRHVDVDTDEDLVRRYGVRVPVVVVDGVEVAELEVAPGAVRAGVRAAVRAAGRTAGRTGGRAGGRAGGRSGAGRTRRPSSGAG